MLLISPMEGVDPPNGDVTYTQQLLAHPPDNVEYTAYTDALLRGEMSELYRRGGRRGRLWFAEPRFWREAIINRARSRGWLFGENFRHFRIKPGIFDAVHVHVFSVALGRNAPPMVISNSISIDALYRDGFGRPAKLVAVMAGVDRVVARMTGVSHSAFRPHRAARLVCFSDHLAAWYVNSVGVDAANIAVVPPGVTVDSITPAFGRPFTIGFIGDWYAKGGDVVLAAHRRVRESVPDARLIVVGSSPPGASTPVVDGVSWLPRQSREDLLQVVIPRFSAFAYPSRFDGLPLTLLEVMAVGVPVVVSGYGALPEIVQHGRSGRVTQVDDPFGLAQALLSLAQGEEAKVLGAAGRQRVAEHYETTKNADLLGQVYAQVTQSDP